MMKSNIIIIVLLLTIHCLYAQQPMRKDTCRTVPKQEQTKPVEPLDSTKFKKCSLCNGRGSIRKEVGTQYVVIASKGKNVHAAEKNTKTVFAIIMKNVVSCVMGWATYARAFISIMEKTRLQASSFL